MAAPAVALAPEDLLPVRDVAFGGEVGGAGAQATNEGGDAPGVVGAHPHGGHLCAGDAVGDGVVDLGVGAALRPVAPGKRRAAVSDATVDAVAHRAGLVVDLASGGDDGRIRAKRVHALRVGEHE